MKTKILILLLIIMPSLLSAGVIRSPLIRTTDILQVDALKLPESNRRSSFPEDPVEKALILGNWEEILQADSITFNDGTHSSWQSIVPVEDGWYQDEALVGGYAYASIDSEHEEYVLLEAMTHRMVYVNGEPRIGNRYQYKEEFESWEPKFNYSFIPIKLEKGTNEFVFRCNRGILKARIHHTGPGQFLNQFDLTIPDMVLNQSGIYTGGLVVINASEYPTEHLQISAALLDGSELVENVPPLGPLEIRKIPFKWHDPGQEDTGELDLFVSLIEKTKGGSKLIDQSVIPVKVVSNNDVIRKTFISEIDGSVQYYAVNPASDPSEKPKALFFSMHGASVEASNQANAYGAKSWGHLVAPTNRRPYGYNWEDWGRLDALEVFDLAQIEYNIDPSQIYLTGHSMGGHGTWIHGATYPDRFAALGPSAGWLSFWSYRVKDLEENTNPVQAMIMRSTTPSQTMVLAENYKDLGIYILHGANDDNVLADQSHQMVTRLKEFHSDFVFHEEPDVGHWWDLSDDPGADCVDWAEMFDYFARHRRPGDEQIRKISFVTGNPGVSSDHYWAEVYAQKNSLEFSRIELEQIPGSRRITGTTENAAILKISTDILDGSGAVQIEIDGSDLNVNQPGKFIWLTNDRDKWRIGSQPDLFNKGPHRYGTFKDAFRNNFLMIIGTQGTQAENLWAWQKARFDAETFWYQGNGSVQIIRDHEFDVDEYPDENIILYGNSKTNAAWSFVLDDAPVEITENKIKVGRKKLKGTDLAALFIYPRDNSSTASVAVVGGTGITGMKLTNMRPYLYAGIGYPDLIIMDSKILDGNSEGLRGAGYFGTDWEVKTGDFIWSD